MGIFKKKPVAKTTIAAAPEEPETLQEIKHINELSENKRFMMPDTQEKKYVEVPIFLSQTQINNLIIENNMMLKELMAMAVDED